MKFKFILFISLILLLNSVFAQDKTYKNEVGFQSDNDGFLATRSDRYYTAGNFLYFHHALKINDTTAKVLNRVLSFELGQKIFTPQTGSIPAAIYVDRPFAGYLYLGSNLNLLYRDESNLKLQLRVGYVGPNAGGEEIQDLIHKTFGFYHPDGWEFQIHNAFQVNGSVEYNRLLTRGKTADLSFNSYANIGTGFTGAGAGLMLRLGRFNQFYNSFSTTSTVSNNAAIKPLHDSEFFFYYKPLLNVVAYDATIQGNLFEASPGLNETTDTITPVVFSQQVGGSYVKGRWVFNLYAIFETHETQEMAHIHWGHQWGAINAEYRF